MDRSSEKVKDLLQRDWNADIKKAESIAKDSGSEALKKPFLQKAKFYGGRNFVLEFLKNGHGYYAGIFCKTHFRLIEIAVRKDEHGNGYGRKLMLQIARRCKTRNIRRITLRTRKTENAKDFYKKFGGKIIGEIGEDYEMEILL